jgi:flagellin
MALVVNTNVASIQAQYNVNKTNQSMQDAMAALSSGKRINTAGDDAAGLSISTRMEAQVRGLSQAIRNANDGISLVDTAEGAMDEITSMLQRMRELAIQSSNGTLNTQDRANLDAEFSQLKSEIDRIVENTRFNDTVLLDGSFSGASLQIGAKSNEALEFSVGNLSTSSLGTQLSALSSASASTSVTARGTAAVENVVNLTFNGNDTYTFDVVFDGDAAKTLSGISASMEANDAADLASAIQAKIDADADTKGLATATASGNTVTLTSLDGTSIKLANFEASANGTLTVNPITNASADSVRLESVTEASAITNTGGTEATASTATLQLEAGKSYSFKVNGTLVEVANTDTDDTAAAAIADAIKAAIEGTSSGTVTVTGNEDSGNLIFQMSDDSGQVIDVTAFQRLTTAEVADGAITFENVIPAGGTVGTDELTTTLAHGENPTDDGTATGTLLAIGDGTTAKLNFSNSDLTYTLELGGNTYSIRGKTHDFQSELTRVAQEITNDNADVTAANVNGVLEISNASGAELALFDAAADTIAAAGITAVDEGNAYFLADDSATDISGVAGNITMEDGSTARSTDGILAEASEMFLDFQGNDRFTFTVDGDGSGTGAVTAEIIADVNDGDLDGVVNSINARFSTTGVLAEVRDNQVVLSKADGTSFSVTGFSSEGTGKIVAVNAGGQGGSAVLQNAGDGDEVLVAASGEAVASTLELSFDAADKFSFKISDGSATAIVRATDVDDAAGTSASLVDDADDVADLVDEITRALTAANMDHISVDASADDGTIILTNSLGTKLEITDFTSDSSGVMTATPGSGQGVGTLLDDDALDGAQASVSAMSLTSVTGAQSAIEALDRAIENVNDQRSKLGAISNRLDHTVSNLGNIVTNTEASKSRIEDADFAAESANLAKNQILLQAGTAMLAQANASQQTVLSLLG